MGRFNVLGYFLIAAGTELLVGAVELVGQPDAFYRAQAYLLFGMVVLLLVWPLIAWRLQLHRDAALPAQL